MSVAEELAGSRYAPGRDVYGSFIDRTIALAGTHPHAISFAVGSPAAEALALVGADELAASAIARDPRGSLGYGVTEGEPELRDAIAAEARARGIAARAEDVIVTAGALQAIDLACSVFLDRGDLVVVESPAFANVLSAFRNHGVRVLEVPVDAQGLRVGEAARALRRAAARPAAFFVVPNFQNPTGVTLSLERREQLLALAASYGALLIEDDPYGALRYRGDDLPPLASLAPRAPIVSIGSFSKVFLPGLRVGWAIADETSVERMAAVKQTQDSSTSSLGQRMVIEFQRRGRFPAHVAALRELYARKQERARAALTNAFADLADTTWTDPEGGFYFWLTLPARVSTRELLDVALAEGVAFVPGDAFAVERDHARSLRFSYSGTPLERIDEGVARLRRAVDRVLA